MILRGGGKIVHEALKLMQQRERELASRHTLQEPAEHCSAVAEGQLVVHLRTAPQKRTQDTQELRNTLGLHGCLFLYPHVLLRGKR